MNGLTDTCRLLPLGSSEETRGPSVVAAVVFIHWANLYNREQNPMGMLV